MPEATVAFLVSPAVQEHYQPAGHNLPRQSIGNIRFDLDPSWKPFVGYSLVAWAELTTHWDTVIEEQVKKAEERATDITIHLNAAIDVINQMQQNIDKVSHEAGIYTTRQDVGLIQDQIVDILSRLNGLTRARSDIDKSMRALEEKIEDPAGRIDVQERLQRNISEPMRREWQSAHDTHLRSVTDHVEQLRQSLTRSCNERLLPLTQRVEGLEGCASGAQQSLTRSCDETKQAWTAALDEFKRHVTNQFELSLARSNNMQGAWTGRIDEFKQHVATQLEQDSARSNNRQEEWTRRFDEHKRDVSTRFDLDTLRSNNIQGAWTRMFTEHQRDVVTRFGEASAWLENIQGAWTRRFAGLERDTGSRFEQQGLEIAAQLRNIPAMLRAEFESGLSRAIQNAHQLSQADLNALKTVLEEVCSGRVESGLSRAIQNAHQLSQADLNALKTVLEEVCSGRVESELSRDISQARASAEDRINGVDQRLSRIANIQDESRLSQANKSAVERIDGVNARLSRIADMQDQSRLSRTIERTQRETQQVRAVMNHRASFAIMRAEVERPLRDRVIILGRGGNIRLWKVRRVANLLLSHRDLHRIDPARPSAPRSQGSDAVGII
ncbi:MAG: hypothetical protein LQ338_007710 [Usnochroma carphineum]|nr:MAG: hypothetical protein LQ338_007710 [Usnochroma carphineum]